jgi:hypothetical protein
MIFAPPLPPLATNWPRSVALSLATIEHNLIDGFELLATRLGKDRLKSGINVLDAGAGTPHFLDRFSSAAVKRGYKVNPFAVDQHLHPHNFEEVDIPFHKGSWMNLPSGEICWPKSYDVVNLNAPNGIPSLGEILKLTQLCSGHGLLIIRYVIGEEYNARDLVRTINDEPLFSGAEILYRPELKLDLETYPNGGSTFALGAPILIKKSCWQENRASY